MDRQMRDGDVRLSPAPRPPVAQSRAHESSRLTHPLPHPPLARHCHLPAGADVVRLRAGDALRPLPQTHRGGTSAPPGTDCGRSLTDQPGRGAAACPGKFRSVRLAMVGARPAYHFMLDSGACSVWADTGEPHGTGVAGGCKHVPGIFWAPPMSAPPKSSNATNGRSTPAITPTAPCTGSPRTMPPTV
jgi:hypothetical protein